jgi:hypothetical protein
VRQCRTRSTPGRAKTRSGTSRPARTRPGIASCSGDLPDGSILDTSTLGSFSFTVVGVDNAANETTVIHASTVVDTTAPTITLLGANPLIHEVGQPFIDPGADVADNVDATVTISGDSTGVDPDILGGYTITYDHTDTAGNPATAVTRDVTVVDSSLPVREFAEADFTRHGTLTGTYLDRFEPDGSLEGINETPSGGKPSQRTSQLEHTWNIPFRGGDAVVHLLASASAGDECEFSYSTNGTGWTDMDTMTVDSATTGELTFELPIGLPAGDLFIKVVDTNRTTRDTSLDSVSIDQLYVES